eukprot:TRINITY_DN7398_c0_g2_i2.p1 TRINITY_DN7398_c0_g2~~TRINITY_DN7398_c0_g2_i2.p1  ORF type:complete len:359 (-),score=31.67 TRINITY_DN7398_c0_g2_i2:276-1352(-)
MGQSQKRKNGNQSIGELVVKRQKHSNTPMRNTQIAKTSEHASKSLVPANKKRTSNLQAPIMLLTGHSGEVFSLKFSPDGDILATGSHDKQILVWRTFDECENYMMLKGHKSAVAEVQWGSDGERIFSASPDKTIRAWDVETGMQVKKMCEHKNFVHTCCPLKRSPHLVVSGSDDRSVKVWDLRVKKSVQTIEEGYPILSVVFGEGGDSIYAAGIENSINVWDLRKERVSLKMMGHSDTITGMKINCEGTHLLSNSMDNTLRVWDIRPFAPANRCVKLFTGHSHSFEHNILRCDWSPDGRKVSAGSSDRFVYIWDVQSRNIQYRLPGHTASVNEVVFHPKQPIIASAGSDKNIYLGEIS